VNQEKNKSQPEIWKDIPGHENYQVSTLGRVKSKDYTYQAKRHGSITTIHRTGVLLKNILRHGYCHVHLGRNFQKSVHRLVLITFIGNPKKGQEVCHNNGICIDNCLNNLRWDTSVGNHSDKIRHHTDGSGERSTNHKLTWEKVERIREIYRFQKISMYKLAKIYGVTASGIEAIINNKTWKPERKPANV
jgi:hypothetical protein